MCYFMSKNAKQFLVVKIYIWKNNNRINAADNCRGLHCIMDYYFPNFLRVIQPGLCKQAIKPSVIRCRKKIQKMPEMAIKPDIPDSQEDSNHEPYYA